MASKFVYTAVAIVGIAAAGGAAWWLQQPKNALPASATTPGAADSSAPRSSAARPAQGSAQSSASGAAPSRPPTVEAGKVESARLTDDAQAVGTLRSRRSVVVRPEVSGRITQLNFTDGQRVKKGQLLVQFDDQLQQAQVLQTQAELSIARANQKRNQDLVAQNFISQRSVDESNAIVQVAEAKLSLAKATAARLKITAPFDGIAGIRLVNVGDYLKDGADIVNIEDIEAVFVDFRLPERFQAKLRTGQTALLDIDALPGRKFTARVQAIDPLIDANGRSVGVRGCIDNRPLQLRPGMFARVNTVFAVRNEARMVPEEAIVPQGNRQFVIKLLDGPDGPASKTKTTQRVEVKTGLRSPGKVEITEGLEIGESIVTTGQQRAQRDGMLVTVVDLSASRPGAGAAASAPGAPGSSAISASPAASARAIGASAASPASAASAALPTAPVAPASAAAPTASASSAPAANKGNTSAKPAPAAAGGPDPCGPAPAAGKPDSSSKAKKG